MELKILHAADLHLDSPFQRVSGEERRMLKDAQLEIPDRLLSVSREHGCQLWLLAGDIFDGQPSYESRRALTRALEECGVPVFIAPGNHDYYGFGSPWNQGQWPENVHIFTEERLQAVELPELGCRVYGGAFGSMDCPPLLRDFEAVQDGLWNLGVLHGDPVSPNSPYCPVTRQQAEGSGLDYLALGHVHLAGSFRAGKTLCGWPGCPMGRGWDETGEKGVYVVTLGRRAEIDTVPLGLPGFFELRTDIGADASAAVYGLLAGGNPNNHYRVTLTGVGSANPGELQREYSRFPYLELRDRTEPEVDVWSEAGKNSLRGLYFAMLREREEANPEQRELIALAADISRKLLLGREDILP